MSPPEQRGAFFDRVPVGMVETTADGRVVRANRAFCALSDYTNDELVGFDVLRLVPPGTPLPLTSGGGGEEWPIRRKDGATRWVHHVESRAATDCEGDLCLRVFVDVTERKAAEADLQRKAEQLRAVQRVAQIGSWELDHETNLLSWSEETYRIFHVDPREARPLYAVFLERVHPLDRARLEKSFGAAVRAHEVYEIDHRLLLPDGTVRHVYELAQTFYAADGRPLRSLGTAQDVTERQLAQQQLQARERTLTSMLTALRDGVALVRVEASGLYLAEVNPVAYERLRAYLPELPREVPRGVNFEPFIEPLTRGVPQLRDARGLIERVLAERKPLHFEMEGGLPGGPKLYSEVTLMPVPATEGAAPLILFVSHEVTEQKTAEALLRRSLLEKETLLAEVHHRVKNNLQIISSMLSLQSTETTDLVTRTVLEEATSRIHTMALVHEQLYRTQDFASVDLERHLESLATMVARSVQQSSITLLCRLEPLSVSLDQAIPLGLIINELLSNAYRHAFRDRLGGTVTVSCRRQQGTGLVEVQVRDDGVGIASEPALEAARTLGFRIVLTLIKQLRATLAIDRGAGTTFTVVLPAEPSVPAPPGPEGQRASSGVQASQ